MNVTLPSAIPPTVVPAKLAWDLRATPKLALVQAQVREMELRSAFDRTRAELSEHLARLDRLRPEDAHDWSAKTSSLNVMLDSYAALLQFQTVQVQYWRTKIE